MSFKDFVKAAKAAGVERSDPFEVTLNGVTAQMVVERADGGVWAAAAVHPPRVDVAADRAYGYNVNAAIAAVIPSSVLIVEDGADVRPRPEEWADIMRALDGEEAAKITNTVWLMNIILPAERADALKKASEGSSEKKLS